MSYSSNEDCPVCWRSFSAALSPYTIPCGHSLCQECSQDLGRCPLCRKRLVHGYPRVRNYALSSLIDKVAKEKIEKKDQEIQTDLCVPRPKPRLKPQEPSNTLEYNAGRPLNLRFQKDSLGNIKKFEIKFK